MNKFFLSTIFLLSLSTMSIAQYSAMEAAILNIPENIEIVNGRYMMHYYTDTTHCIISCIETDSCKIEITETDSLIVDVESLYSNYPTKLSDFKDTAFLVYYSRTLHKMLHQPILYNMDLNYFSAIDTWGDECAYMITAIIKGESNVILRNVNLSDTSINDIKLNSIKSKRITHKIKKIAKMPVNSYECEDFILPPVIIEYKFNGKYNAFPIVTLEAPKPYIRSFNLMRKLRRITVREVK